jgi:exodeoxyribonuclease-5
VDKNSFKEIFSEFFGMKPTEEQTQLLEKLTEFVFKKDSGLLFLLKGYAGTGKTSMLGALVKTLKESRVRSKLMAPTGRAAKVLGLKSNAPASTIHKVIYRRSMGTDGQYKSSLTPNLHKDTLFIVDEASMIGDYTMNKDGSISGNNLLEDLIEFVYSGKDCKMIFLGDEGQLPPVGSDYSPALSKDYLKENFIRLDIDEMNLKQVVRQAEGSSILMNATYLRSAEEYTFPKFTLQKGGDLIRLPGDEIQDVLDQSMTNLGPEETIVVTRSNKRANLFNNHIRARILWYEEELCSGELLMAVKNNYYWLDDDSSMGFIANGEMMIVKRYLKTEELYGFRFAKVIVKFVDYPFEPEKELMLLIDTLQSEGPSLNREDAKRLFFAIEEDYMDEKNKKKRYEKIRRDPYFNALQVKYAYAVTCHKSQGGQWTNVFIDQGYLTDEMLDASYFRWLYTALTRATEKAYFINFKPDFFEDEED